MTKLAQNLDQFKKHRGDFMTGFGASVSPALNKFLTEDLPKAKNTYEAMLAITKEMNSSDVSPVERRQLAEKFGLDPNAARITLALIEDTKKQEIDLTDKQEAGLVRLGVAWDHLAQSVSEAARKITADLAPVSDLIKKIAKFVHDNPEAAGGIAAGAGVVGAGVGIGTLKWLFGGGKGAAAVKGVAGEAGGLGILGRLGAIGGLGAGAWEGAKALWANPGHALGGSGWDMR